MKEKDKLERMRQVARSWYSDPSYSMNNIYGDGDAKFYLGDDTDDDDTDDEMMEQKTTSLAFPADEPQDISFEEAQNALREEIKSSEYRFEYPYLDYNKPLNTFCWGHTEETAEGFAKHPWFDKTMNNNPATTSKKTAEFNRLASQYAPNHTAAHYDGKTDLGISPEYCDNLLEKDIAERHKILQKSFPNYQKMSPSMQAAVQEVNYNVGIGNFPMAKKFADQMNQDEMCNQLHRLDKDNETMQRRNKWVDDMCRQGYFIK